jgi:hypothetical protein
MDEPANIETNATDMADDLADVAESFLQSQCRFENGPKGPVAPAN